MKFSKFLKFKIFFILVISPLFFNVPKAYTAEEIKITYSIFSRTIKVNSLKTFAKEGKPTKKLKKILKATGSPDKEIKEILNNKNLLNFIYIFVPAAILTSLTTPFSVTFFAIFIPISFV